MTKELVRTAGVAAKIEARHLQTIRQKHYHLGQLAQYTYVFMYICMHLNE
jgi:hypothetical protein